MIFLREKFIAQIFMWVIAVVFVIASVLLYSGSSGQGGKGTEDEVVLKIGASEVTRGIFEDAVSNELRRQQNQRFRELPDREQVQKNIIESYITRAIQGSANISDAEIEHYIRSDANLVEQYNKFGPDTANYLRNQVRFYLSATALQDNIRMLELVTDTEAEHAFRLEADKAKVKYIEFRHTDYISTIEVDDTEAAAVFEENKDDYKTDEQVNVKFIKLDPADFVSTSDVETYYAENQAEFSDSLVRARHILKKFPDDATDEQKAETKTAAEELLTTVKAELDAGTSFADLAKTHSEDTGSAVDGGALGESNPDLPPGKYFGRGQMVKPFEEACFDILKPGEVSDLVESVFGYHIIQLEDKTEHLKSFPEVESEIREKLVQLIGVDNAKEVADSLLFEIDLEDFETAIGLDKYKELSLAVGETDFFSKDGGDIPNIGSKFIYRGLVEELFDMEVDVTKTIETKNFRGETITAYFVATVLGKKPAGIPKFEDVKAEVINNLRDIKAKERALADAQNLFAQRKDAEVLDDLIKKYKAPEGLTAEQKSVQESSLFNRVAGSSYVSGMGNSKDVMFTAFKMAVGDVEGPFQGDLAAYIVELVERVEPDVELFKTDPVQKTQRHQTLLDQKKSDAYDNWLASRKKAMAKDIWIHEDYR